MVSIVIVNYNGLAHTRNALESILRHSPSSETIVVDNCSSDGSVDALRNEFPTTVIHSAPRNGGFAFGCNRGAELARGEYLFFMNNDALLKEDTPAILSNMMEKNSTWGACGPGLVNSDGSFQLSLGLDPSLFSEWIVRRWQRLSRTGAEELRSFIDRKFADKPVDWITGAALMVRRAVFEKIGGFDESFFMYFEDADVCRRIRNLGMEVMYVPRTTLTHVLGRSYTSANIEISIEYRRSQLRIYDKSRSLLERMLIRLFLSAKFGWKLLRPSERELSISVITLLFRDRG